MHRSASWTRAAKAEDARSHTASRRLAPQFTDCCHLSEVDEVKLAALCGWIASFRLGERKIRSLLGCTVDSRRYWLAFRRSRYCKSARFYFTAAQSQWVSGSETVLSGAESHSTGVPGCRVLIMWNKVSFIEVSQSLQGQSDKHIDFDTPETPDIFFSFFGARLNSIRFQFDSLRLLWRTHARLHFTSLLVPGVEKNKG